jgi:hypothetical protein
MVVSYGRELEYLQSKYEGRAIDMKSNSNIMALKEGINLLEKLYLDIEGYKRELSAKNELLAEQEQ